MRTVRAGLIAIVLGTAAVSGISACGKTEDPAPPVTPPSDAATIKDTAIPTKDAGADANAPDATADTTTPPTDTPAALDLGIAPLDTAGLPAAPESFAGNWKYEDGQAQLTCPGRPALTEQLDGFVITFAIGSGVAPLILTSPGCNLYFDINGQSAVVQPGQSCKNPVANRPATSAPTMFSFTLQGMGAQLTVTWTVTFADAPNTPCTMTSQGSLVRAPKP